MAKESVIILCLAFFTIGTGCGMIVPLFVASIYEKMIKSDIDIFNDYDNDLSNGKVPLEQKETKQHER